jgi:hypothetical protein
MIVASVSTLYDLFYVFSEPLPLVFTLIHRIDEFTAHQRAPSLHVSYPPATPTRHG